MFTHTYFHPWDVMVVDEPSGIVELSGILDWEANGFYSERGFQQESTISPKRARTTVS